MRRPRRRFAAPFVMTLAAAAPACSGSGGTAEPVPKPPASDLGRTWWVSRSPMDPARCQASEQVGCPPQVRCNPPPPIPIECPTGFDQPGVRIGEVAPGSCAFLPDPCRATACATTPVPCPAYPRAEPAPAPAPAAPTPTP